MSFKTQLGYIYLINEGLTVRIEVNSRCDETLCIYEHESVYKNKVGRTY